MTNALVTLSSRAVYGPRKGQNPEDPWVITRHAVWARTMRCRVWLRAEQLSDTGFLHFWPVDSRPSYGLVWVTSGLRVYDPHSTFKIIVQAPFGSPYGFLTGLQNSDGFRMGSFDFLAYSCSNTRMASARAHMKSTCTRTLWKHRGHARVIQIRCLKHTENP